MAVAIIGSIAKGLLAGGGKKAAAQAGAQAAGQQMAQKMLSPSKENKGGALVAQPRTQFIPVYADNKQSSTTKSGAIVKTGNAQLDDSIRTVQVSVIDLGSVLKDQEKFKRKQAEDKRKRRIAFMRKLGSGALGLLGLGFGFAKGIASKIPFADKIKRFLTNVLLGSLIGWFTQNFERISEWWKKDVEPILKNLKEWVFDPIWGFVTWLSGPARAMMDELRTLPLIGSSIGKITDMLDDLEALTGSLESDSKDLEGKVRAGKYGSDLPPSERRPTGDGGPYAPGAGKRATGAVTSTTAQAQVKKAGFEQQDYELYRDVVANIESGGKYDIQGGSGKAYAGRYQMGAAARQDAARLLGETYQGDSEEARRRFREDPEMQERYFAAYTRANHGYLMDGSPEYRNLSREGKLQVLGYAHNAGAGNAIKWLRSGMSESFRDGFGTRSDKYSTEIRAAQQSGSNPLDDLPPMQQPAYSSGGSGTFINPTPQTNLKQQKGGYAADTGLDIHGNIGDPIVSPVSGTLEYAEAGHTTQANQDSDPTKPGKQPQYSFRIKLDKPVTINGKTVRFVYGTHLASLDPAVANKSGIKIRQGQRLGTMGQANNVPHLHLGLVGDRRQTEFLNFKEVDAALGGRYSSDPTPTRPDTRAQSVSTTPSYQRPKPKIIPVPIDNTPPMQQKPAGATSTRSLNRSERRNRNAALYKS